MKHRNTCSEHEATILAGVSSKTLKRFHESGYLHVLPDSDGSPLYSREEILEIFGSSECVVHTDSPPSYPTSPASSDDSNERETERAVALEGKSCTSSSSKPSNDYSPCGAEEHGELSSDTGESVPCDLEDPTLPNKSDPSVMQSPKMESFDRLVSASELERLQNLISIQEKMLDSKEDEIADLKNQRAWLRERIERLEEKGERDQILLLSETQTIRSLISYQENKRSPVRQLLEWMGLAKPEEAETSKSASGAHPRTTTHRTIEVGKVANE